MSISGNQLRAGMAIQYEGKIWVCMSSEHRTPGNKRAFMQAKMRNVMDGTQKEFKFSATESLERIDLIARDMQFMYEDQGTYHFMDQESYEQIELTQDTLGNQANLLLPETVCKVTFYEQTPIGIKLPKTMDYTITEAEPNMKNATATAAYKNAVIETGATIKVPPFIEAGEKITIDTETGEYLRRAN